MRWDDPLRSNFNGVKIGSEPAVNLPAAAARRCVAILT